MRARWLLLPLPFVVGIVAAVALAAGAPTTGTVTACASATSPARTLAADGTPIATLPEVVASRCEVATYTASTVTEQQTVTQTVTVGTTTSPPPPPPTTTAPPPTTTQASASLYLSPTGNDAGNCTSSAPCKTFARVYTVAQSGATVLVRAGVYPSQFFAGGANSSQAAGTKAITFVGEAGNFVRQIHFGSPNLTFDGINADAQGAKLGGSDGAVLENGGAPFTFRNGAVGNVADQKGALVDGPGIVFDNVRFHDVLLKTAGVHTECIFVEVPEGMILRNSTFSNCAVMDVFFVWPGWWSPAPPAYGNVTLEGNTFGAPVPPNGSVYVGGTGPNGDTQARNWTIRNNSFGSSGVWGDMDGSRMCGNSGAVDASWKTAC